MKKKSTDFDRWAFHDTWWYMSGKWRKLTHDYLLVMEIIVVESWFAKQSQEHLTSSMKNKWDKYTPNRSQQTHKSLPEKSLEASFPYSKKWGIFAGANVFAGTNVPFLEGYTLQRFSSTSAFQVPIAPAWHDVPIPCEAQDPPAAASPGFHSKIKSLNILLWTLKTPTNTSIYGCFQK